MKPNNDRFENLPETCSRVCDELRSRWLAGGRPSAESFFEQWPEIANCTDAMLEVIYAEYLVRVRLRENPNRSEYCERFASLQDQLGRLFEMDDLFGEHLDEEMSTEQSTSSTAPSFSRCGNCSTVFPMDHKASSNVHCFHCGHEIIPAQSPISLHSGLILGKFELNRRLGGGRFGDVWLATDLHLKRSVALKLPRMKRLEPKAAALVLNEAQAAARLNHPNIVAVYDVVPESEQPFIVTAYIEGQNLKDRLEQSPLSLKQSAELCRRIALAVEHAHQAGIIHRDLKPANVMLDCDETPYVADFGLAKFYTEHVADRKGQAAGTPAYMSPEELRGDANVGPASDVYSQGVILYELLTGRRPFEGNLEAVVAKRAFSEPVVPSKLNPEIPRDLETICLNAMATNPADRYSSSAGLAADLDAWLHDRPIIARRQYWFERGWRWCKKNRVAALCGIAATIAAVLLVFEWNRPAAATASNGAPALPPAASTPQGASPRQVIISAIDDQAQFTFIPLGHSTGEPLPEQAINGGSGETPTLLWPGDYLVVAVAEEDRFHEVLRRVPDQATTVGEFHHQKWTFADGGIVQLPPVFIPRSSDFIREMAFFDENEKFLAGIPNSPQAPAHHRAIPAFYMDTNEVTPQQFAQNLFAHPTSITENYDLPDDSVAAFSYDQAIDYAERQGKRLPTEMEYEFAASRALTDQRDKLTAQDMPTEDQDVIFADDGKKVWGLNSGVAEWSSSWLLPYPNSPIPLNKMVWGPDFRIVRGGVAVLVELNAKNRRVYGPRDRIAKPRNTFSPHLGFRCARSSKPRLLPEDFEHVVAE